MENEKQVTYEEGYGYHQEGEPTDFQLELQDDIDHDIFLLMNKMQKLYSQACKEVNEKEIDWNIHKITMIREELQKELNLPDVY